MKELEPEREPEPKPEPELEPEPTFESFSFYNIVNMTTIPS